MLNSPADGTPRPAAESSGTVAGRLADRLRGFEREHRPFLAVIVAYVGAAAGADVFLQRGFRLDGSAVLTALALAIIFAGGSAAVFATRVTFKERRGRGSLLRLDTWREFAAHHMGRWLGGFVVFAMLVGPFRTTFIYFKQLIPVIQPFAWDRRFADWDRALHLGNDPWELLHGWLGHPAITDAIDVAYHFWFPLGILLVTWQAFSGREPVRMQFLVSYMLVWMVLGNGAATLLSSAGPCYYAQVTGDAERFAPLLQYLEQVHQSRHLMAVETMEFLWAGYEGRISINLGISAMPSVHVAVSVLYAILGWKTARWLGIALTAFAAITLLGSVHLAWHYALDGYVSAIATPVLWVATGRALRWYARRTGERGRTADAAVPAAR